MGLNKDVHASIGAHNYKQPTANYAGGRPWLEKINYPMSEFSRKYGFLITPEDNLEARNTQIKQLTTDELEILVICAHGSGWSPSLAQQLSILGINALAIGGGLSKHADPSPEKARNLLTFVEQFPFYIVNGLVAASPDTNRQLFLSLIRQSNSSKEIVGIVNPVLISEFIRTNKS